MRLPLLCLVPIACVSVGLSPGANAEPVPYAKIHSGKHAFNGRSAARHAVRQGSATNPVPPTVRVRSANAAAVQEPIAEAFRNAMQVYPYREGALYRLYAAPDKVSDVTLQSGEDLIAISAGDTARWIIGDTYSGEGEARRVHILVKPYARDLRTNLVITTSRRTYHLQLESTASISMTAVSWTYQQDELLALKTAQAEAVAAAPKASGISVADLQFRYVITGDKPTWRPQHVFDDGQQVFIEFPQDLSQDEAPPLFIIGASGKAELVNYRIARNIYIVDRLFSAAELRLGGKRQAVVRITRNDVPRSVRHSIPGIGGGHD